MATRCKCSFCPNGIRNGTCLLEKGGYCFTHVEVIYHQDEVSQETTYGCFNNGIEGLLQCKGGLVPHSNPQFTECCKNKDFCNLDIELTIDPKIIEEINNEETSAFDFNIFIAIFVTSIILILLFTFLFLFLYRRKKINDAKNKLEKKLSESNDSVDKINYPFDTTSCKPLIVYPQFDTKFSEYHNLITPRTSMSYNMTNGSSMSDSSSSALSIKYAYLNNSNSSHNGSNYMINNYRNLSSTTSNTTSSMASEITQQTTLSSQKPTSISSLPPLDENSMTSGSGSGIPHLVQQTLAREIQLTKLIGNGRYGTVWHGLRKCEHMAVKIFASKDEASWRREIEIYTTVIMRQENILGFFGADITSKSSTTEMWLVTEYCQMGSLYDYLSRQSIDNVFQLLSLMKSIISGISHLHTEVIGTMGKPAIAHRDIKSKNILMKSDFSCCIGDFGLAVTKTQTDCINVPQNYRVGTKRYMAPEVLSETMKSQFFDSYRSADVYSLALVFWELFNRFQLADCFSEYHVPYQYHVPNDPSFEEMQEVVFKQKLRPTFKQIHSDDVILSKILLKIKGIITESWAQNPSARLTSLRIKKSIFTLFDEAKPYSPLDNLV